jgi:hypothetical protein
MLASLATVEEKNKALIEILKKSILVDEATKSLAETIQKNIGGTNQNIDQARKMIAILQEVLVQRMKNAAETEAALKDRLEEDLAEVKNNQKMVTSRLETLVSLSDQINKQSAQMEKSIQQSVVSASDQINKQSAQMEKSIHKTINIAANNAKAQTDLSNEKLSRLVDILKSFAIEQSKTDRVLQALSVDQAKLTTQENEIIEALKDLRRKANVNISRSDNILKKLKKQK